MLDPAICFSQDRAEACGVGLGAGADWALAVRSRVVTSPSQAGHGNSESFGRFEVQEVTAALDDLAARRR